MSGPGAEFPGIFEQTNVDVSTLISFQCSYRFSKQLSCCSVVHSVKKYVKTDIIWKVFCVKCQPCQVTQPSTCPQVGKLYIRYQLDVDDGEVVEVQDIPCLLKDEKELYIQKDHLSDKQEICRCEYSHVCMTYSDICSLDLTHPPLRSRGQPLCSSWPADQIHVDTWRTCNVFCFFPPPFLFTSVSDWTCGSPDTPANPPQIIIFTSVFKN